MINLLDFRGKHPFLPAAHRVKGIWIISFSSLGHQHPSVISIRFCRKSVFNVYTESQSLADSFHLGITAACRDITETIVLLLILVLTLKVDIEGFELDALPEWIESGVLEKVFFRVLFPAAFIS